LIGQRTAHLAALLSDAATVRRAGDRDAAIAALSSAVGLAPDDLTAHRRLAAAHAVAGDVEAARREYDRFVTRLELRGLMGAAAMERSYARALLAPPPPTPAPRASGSAAAHQLTPDQTVALRRIAVAVIAIAATLAAMFVAGVQIFAGGSPL
jgi:DNA-binding SARP family transcriptional activator